MKKILIVLLLLITCVFGLSQQKKVSAYSNIANWEVAHYLTDECFMHLTIEVGINNVFDEISITIPNVNNHNVSSLSATLHSKITMYDVYPYQVQEGGHTPIMQDDLANYITVEEGGKLVLDMTGLETVKAIYVSVYQDFDYSDLPADYESDWELQQSFSYDYADRMMVLYYQKQYANTSYYFMSGDYVYHNNVLKIDPTTTPDDYIFTGWKTITGEYYVFDNYIKNDWLTTNSEGEKVFKLYANYLSTNTPQVADEDDPTNNAPAFISEPMALIHANNTTGYALLFGILNVVIVIVFLIFKLPVFGAVITSFIFMMAFMFMGLLEGWIVLIMFVIYITVIIGSIRLTVNSGGSEI